LNRAYCDTLQFSTTLWLGVSVLTSPPLMMMPPQPRPDARMLDKVSLDPSALMALQRSETHACGVNVPLLLLLLLLPLYRRLHI
jgi:hypothetical protein